VSRGTQDAPRARCNVVYRALTFCGWPSQAIRLSHHGPTLGSYNPEAICMTSVWALPGSLATTTGISFDFSSSRY
jgi:hypothetical protein